MKLAENIYFLELMMTVVMLCRLEKIFKKKTKNLQRFVILPLQVRALCLCNHNFLKCDILTERNEKLK